jgi:hypothetical protein
MSEHMTYDAEVVAYDRLHALLSKFQEELSARRAAHDHQSGLARDLFVNLIDATTTQVSMSKNEAIERRRTAFDNAHGIARLKESLDAALRTGSNARGFDYVTQDLGDVDEGFTGHNDTPAQDKAA